MKKALLFLAVGLSLALTGCTTGTADTQGAIPDFSLIIVTSQGETTIDQATVSSLAVLEEEVVLASSNGESTSTWAGFTLVDVLALAGVTEFTTLSIEASDGYAQQYSYDIAAKALVTYLENGEALGDNGPLNTVVPGEFGNLWMKNLAKITVD